MGLVVVFCLGIINFAAHKAVIVSGHPLVVNVPWIFHLLSGKLSLVVEFVMLVGAMLMVASGASGWTLGYAFYTAINGLAAWLILSGRV